MWHITPLAASVEAWCADLGATLHEVTSLARRRRHNLRLDWTALCVALGVLIMVLGTVFFRCHTRERAEVIKKVKQEV